MRLTEMFRVKYIWFSILCVLLLFCFSREILAEGYYAPLEAVIQVFGLSMDGEGDSTYHFVIEAESSDCPAPEMDAITVEENGVGEFRIKITEPGTYRYKVYEMAGSDQRVIYDDSVFHVFLVVTQSDAGELIYSVTADAEGYAGKPEKIEFRNEIEKPSSEIETETEKSTTPKKAVQTGDNSSITVWFVLMLLSAGIALLLTRRKQRI